MLKKMMLLALSVAALVAFAVPAAAQATVTLTEDETELPAGSKVVATSSNSVFTTSKGTLECETVLNLEVLANGFFHVVLKQLGEVAATNCKLNIGITKLAAIITDGTLGLNAESKITLGTNGTGVAAARFGMDVPAASLSCVFEGNAHVLATDGTNVLHVGPSIFAASGAGCVPATWEGSFTLALSHGAPVEVDAVN